MNLPAACSIVALACYLGLVYVALRRGGWATVNRLFTVYLLAMAFWQVAALVVSISREPRTALNWYELMTAGASVDLIVYYFFVRAVLRMRGRDKLVYVGYAACVATIALSIWGGTYIIESVYWDASTGLYVPNFGVLVWPLAACGYFFLGHALLNLSRGYRRAESNLERKRLKYLMLGIGIFVLGTLANFLPFLRPYPLDVIANILNALLIAYAILRYRLLDINVVVRKGLLYSIPTVIIGTCYFLLISMVESWFHAYTGPPILLLSLSVAAVTAVAAQPLRDKAQSWIDRFFFRESYDSRLMLRRLSQTATTILDLDHLTNLILAQISDVMHIEKAAVFLRREESGEFYQAAQRGLGLDGPLGLRKDHPIALWMSSHEQPLTRHDLEAMPQFRALWGRESEDLDRLGAEMLLPLRVTGQLVGILAVGQKRSEGAFSEDDELTLTTLANQTAVAIENARLYRVAQQELAERSWAQELLRRARDQLETRVQERTAELARANKALQVEVAERRRVEEQIQASLGEKEVLLKEVHHRVKNNLQLICSLLNLQARYLQDGQAVGMFEDSQARIRSMALIHEKFYQSQELSSIDLGGYLRSLATQLLRSYGTNPGLIGLSVEAEKTSLSIQAAIPCGLIVNELVSNSLKHGFPDSRPGEIRVGFHANDGTYTLVVGDNGVGLPECLDYQHPKSLGLQLVNTLVNQLGGSLEHRAGGGTEFKITFVMP